MNHPSNKSRREWHATARRCRAALHLCAYIYKSMEFLREFSRKNSAVIHLLACLMPRVCIPATIDDAHADKYRLYKLRIGFLCVLWTRETQKGRGRGAWMVVIEMVCLRKYFCRCAIIAGAQNRCCLPKCASAIAQHRIRGSI